jgi:hypothetical protein
MRGLRDRVGRTATRGSEPFRVTHADELIADTDPASTFGEMHDENVIFRVIPDGRAVVPFPRTQWALTLAGPRTYLDLDGG